MSDTTIGRNLLTALISIAVTVIGGLLLYYFQTKEPNLVYTVDKILPFESQTEKLTIYHINIENSGNTIAEDVVCKIQITPALIKEYRVNTDAPIQFKDSLIKNEIDVNTLTLNPKENYRVSILATTNGVFPEKPIVKIRAKGISGEEKQKDAEKKDEPWLKIFQFLAFAAAVATFITLLIKRFLDDDVKHSGDQNEIIAYLCGIHGLDKQVERYLTLPKTTSYWAEMDRLATIAIATKNNDTIHKLIALIKDLINYAGMADSSKGIGYYNLSRLYKFLNDEANCKSNLKEAKKRIPKLLSTRMSVDPIFKDYKFE